MGDHQVRRIRSVVTAGINGGVTLILLLIAPLGLAAVIINSLLVAVASYFSSEMTDSVIAMLQKGSVDVELLPKQSSTTKPLTRRSDADEDRY